VRVFWVFLQGNVFGKRIPELCLSEFLSYGLQREPGMEGKMLVRKTKDGKIYNWEVEQDDTLCTLQEAFLKVEPSLGFNIELKFDDHIVYEQAYLIHVLQAILKVYLPQTKNCYSYHLLYVLVHGEFYVILPK
jgi:glycerophosphodiester phosphodiesterase